MKQKSSDLELLSKRYTIFKISIFGLKIGENEEHYELICKIKLLNIIKFQITS